MPISPEQLLELVRSAKAPEALKSALAKGAIPLPPAPLLEALDLLAGDADPAIADQARGSLDRLPPAIALGVSSSAAGPELLDRLARRFAGNETIAQALARNGSVADGTLAFLATLPFPAVLEIIGRNQGRMERSPVIVANLLANPETPITVLQLWHEHEERHIAAAQPVPHAAAEIEEELIPQEMAKDLVEEDEEAAVPIPAPSGEALSAKQLSVYQILKRMSMGQKVALAVKGNREVRNLLIHETNRMLALKVLENPRIADSDVEAWCKATNLSEDVLRGIAAKKEWVKKPGILKGLVFNPKTPLGITLDFVKRLGKKDLELLSKNRNVPETLRNTARRLFTIKRDSNQ